MAERFIAKTKRQTRTNEPFSKIADEFLKFQEGKGNSKETIKHYLCGIRKLKKFFCWMKYPENEYYSFTDQQRYTKGGEVPISIFNENDFEINYRHYLLDIEEVSDITVCTHFRDYRAIAYWLMNKGYIDKREIALKNVESDIKEVYSDSEIAKLLRKPKVDCSFVEYRNWVVIHHFLATGNRISTVCAIKLKDIDWQDGMLSIQVQKNKRKTRIPLESTYLKVLREYVDTWLTDDNGEFVCEYLFPCAFVNSPEQMNRVTLGRSIAEYNISRKVSKTSSHLFRHTFAKHWIMSGKDLHSLQKMLGHSTLDMVTHYANLYDVDLIPKVEESSILKDYKQQSKIGCKLRTRRK
ncbi:MAG: site-specific integrase [Clostridia bacterium]|nr:site-specific integrase [Clostridia bacterium]